MFFLSLLVSLVLPDQVPGIVVTLAFALGMQEIAQKLQGEALKRRLHQDAARHSHWRVLGITAISLLCALIVLVPVVLVMSR